MECVTDSETSEIRERLSVAVTAIVDMRDLAQKAPYPPEAVIDRATVALRRLGVEQTGKPTLARIK